MQRGEAGSRRHTRRILSRRGSTPVSRSRHMVVVASSAGASSERSIASSCSIGAMVRPADPADQPSTGPPATPVLPFARPIRKEPHDQHRRRRPVPVHVRIGDRGSPGQDVRPDLGRDPGRHHRRGPQRAGGLRDGDHDGARAGARRDHHRDVRRLPGGRPRHGQGHRLHARRLRLRLPDLRHAGVRQGAVAGHRDGRRRGARGPGRQGAPPGAGRRRPGDDVRVRVPRDPGADAAADRARAPHGAAPRRGAQERRAALPAARRQDPGHRGVRARRAQAGAHRGRLLAA